MPIPVIPAGRSDLFRPPIPEHSGHLFRSIPAGCSGGFRPPRRSGATLELKDASSANRVGDFWVFNAFLKMEVIHSHGATSFNQLGRSGAVDYFLTFNSFVRSFKVKGGLIFSG